MSKIDAVNVNSNYNTNYINNGQQQTAHYGVSYTGGLDSDVYEGSKSKTKKVVGGIVGLATLTAGALWLWKGKGWSKLQNLYNKFFGKATQEAPKVVNRANPEVAEEIIQKNANQSNIISNIETVNANQANRRAVERAIKDTPTPAQQAAYDKSIAYQAPTKEEAKIIATVNKEAAEKSAQARQIGNNISDAQVQSLKSVGESAASGVKKGVYKSKDGYTLTYNKQGNIEKIVTPDGRTIIKPKSIYNYEQKIDLTDLQKA